MIICRPILLGMRNISHKSCRELQNTHFMCNNFLFENHVVYEITWKNTVESGRPHTTKWRMWFACWTHKYTRRICNTSCNSGCANASQCYVRLIRTLHVLFSCSNQQTKAVSLYCYCIGNLRQLVVSTGKQSVAHIPWE